MLRPGDPLPPLRLQSAGGALLELASLRGRRGLLWYEDRDGVDDNQPLHRALEHQRRTTGHAPDLAIVAVADLRGFDWFPARGIVERAVRQLERRHGAPIYCDFDGAIGSALDAPHGRSQLLILDRDLHVQQVFGGPVGAADRAAIVAATAPATPAAAAPSPGSGA